MKNRILLILSLFISVHLYSQNIDIRLLRSINSSTVQPADHFFKFVSNSTTIVFIGVPATLGIAGLLKNDDKLIRNAEIIVVASALNLGITEALKYSVRRERPFIKYPDITKKSDAGDPSFPSGHTSGAFATATTLSLLYPKWYVVAPSFLWAGTVGYSRMYLGVHFPSDVFAGAVIGAGSAFLTYKANQWINNHYAKKQFKP